MLNWVRVHVMLANGSIWIVAAEIKGISKIGIKESENEQSKTYDLNSEKPECGSLSILKLRGGTP